MSHLQQRCLKPGCGALKITGSPCTDWDCPQRFLTSDEYKKAIFAETAALKKSVEELENSITLTAAANTRAAVLVFKQACSLDELDNSNDELKSALQAIIDRSNNDLLGTSKVNDMRNIAIAALQESLP